MNIRRDIKLIQTHMSLGMSYRLATLEPLQVLLLNFVKYIYTYIIYIYNIYMYVYIYIYIYIYIYAVEHLWVSEK